MKVVKWIVFFVISFIASLIIIMTFSQEPFRQKVGGRIFGYTTQPIEIYWYICGAFVLGLLIGLFVALTTFIIQQMKVTALRKELRAHEESQPAAQDEKELTHVAHGSDTAETEAKT